MQTLRSPSSLAAWLDRAVRLTWFLSWVGLPLLFVLLVFPLQHALGGTSGILLAVYVDAPTDAALTLARPAVASVESARLVVNRATLIYEPGNPLMSALIVAALAFGMGAWLLIVHRLKQITGTLRDGHPFVVDNARRMRTIGLAICGWFVVDNAMQFLGQRFARSHFTLEIGEFPLLGEWQAMPLFAGLLILVIAEVFRIGALLQEDHDATI